LDLRRIQNECGRRFVSPLGGAGRRRAAFAVAPLLVILAACGAQSTPAQTSANLVTQGLKAQLSGDAATAEHDYLQAIALNPNSDVAHFDLGTVYDEQAHKTQAVQEYQMALVIAPNFADALFNLAVDTAGTNPPSAEELYSKVVSLQPSFAAAWLNLGFTLLSEGKAGQAQTDWAKAVAIDPTLASRLPKATAAPSPVASPTPKPTR
jgi:tetratricopeptide (TPR) repeat protein